MKRPILVATLIAVFATIGWLWTRPTEFGVVFTYGFWAIDDHGLQSHTGLPLSELVRRDQPFDRIVWAAWLSLALRIISYLAWAAVFIMLIVAIHRRRRSRRRVRAGACHICGYDLTSLQESIWACPECGQLIWPDQPESSLESELS